jgi:hypothetical protein
MNERSSGTRQLMRTLIVAAIVALLAVSTTQHAGANQSGIPVGDAAAFQAGLCELAGGTAAIDTDRIVSSMRNGSTIVTVKCKGGPLDGMVCTNLSGNTFSQHGHGQGHARRDGNQPGRYR